MRLMPLNILGAHEQGGNKIFFGVFLPHISPGLGYALKVKVIHESDQFIQGIQPHEFHLSHSSDQVYGDYWSGVAVLNPGNRHAPGSFWGNPGTYVYRYAIECNGAEVLDWIIDPFAREFGIGRQAAFTLGYQPHIWGPEEEETWKTPDLRDLVVYELMLNEFATDLRSAQARIPYLKDLGVNCLEIMPVTNVELTVDWGFLPVGFFGVDERFGNRQNFQVFVEECHRHGLAVILDMIYGHTGQHFAYEYIYKSLGIAINPVMGSFAEDLFGYSTDFNKQFTQDYFYSVNHFWLDCFHIDGVRYDCVPNYYDGCMGKGFSNIVCKTYDTVKNSNGSGHWQRFFNAGKINLIQCAEQLKSPREVLEKTYANCTWQNWTLDAAKASTGRDTSNMAAFGNTLGALTFPDSATHNQDTLDKCVFQYLETHDHSRFLSCFGVKNLWSNNIFEGKREENWFKIQPYMIGLLLAKGIPLLWQGQEIVEKYDIPYDGYGRVEIHRPVRWELFYDEVGKAMIRLVRELLKIRNAHPIFRRGQFHFHNDWQQWLQHGLLLYSRWDSSHYALVALNMTDRDLTTQFWFPVTGSYSNKLAPYGTLQVAHANSPTSFTVPSNYGAVWFK